jgi:isopenicillin N synthase-like dioxygenase
MSTHDAATLDVAQLPIIDIGRMDSGSAAERKAVGEAIRAACLDTGFFYAANHGVPQKLIDRTFAEAKRFFALPMDVKLAMDRAKSRANRGYEPFAGQTHTGGTPDRKEGVYFGIERPEPAGGVAKFSQGPNQWPPGIPGFREAMEEYFAAMMVAGRRLWRALALSVELPEDYFADGLDDPIALLRLLHYPPQPANPDPGEKGCGEHTDFGAFTMLMQDDNGGLQLYERQRGWVHARPIAGTYVVNLGDMIARWTNDRFKSTQHRVINVSGRDRYSIPFFFNVNADHVVECLPTCHDAADPPRYPPVVVSDYMTRRYRETYGN